jgi:hypothetical protein
MQHRENVVARVFPQGCHRQSRVGIIQGNIAVVRYKLVEMEQEDAKLQKLGSHGAATMNRRVLQMAYNIVMIITALMMVHLGAFHVVQVGPRRHQIVE